MTESETKKKPKSPKSRAPNYFKEYYKYSDIFR